MGERIFAAAFVAELQACKTTGRDATHAIAKSFAAVEAFEFGAQRMVRENAGSPAQLADLRGMLAYTHADLVEKFPGPGQMEPGK